MKIVAGLSIVTFIVTFGLAGALAYNQVQRSTLLAQQVKDCERQNSILLTQTENNSQHNIESESERELHS